MANPIKRAFRKLLTPLLWDYTSAEFQCGSLTFSQFGEDVMMRYLFDNDYRGFYVDVGAFHPMHLSNTYALYRQGWRGMAIDANPDCGELYARFRPKDKFIHSAVGTESGTVEMAMFKEATFNCTADQIDQVPEDVRQHLRLVKTNIQPLSEIFAAEKVGKVDLLSVDCEGNDLKVLQSNDWGRWKPSVICVEDHEDDWQESEITLYLVSQGYRLRYRSGFSSIFVAEAAQSAKHESRGWSGSVS
ncbi:MAG: FkbM family methyltransferase [Methylacidiphilales bacterium]|nr:FkbM family methyltransferase [Candidatus Methylacidiphilales bacterium]